MQRERIGLSNVTNPMAAPVISNRGTRRVTVHYEWLGERRERCFRIIDGDLVVSECQAAEPETGLGDVIAGATKAVGVKPCGSCQKRQAAMNKATPLWVGKILSWFKG
jgi:hypothetical protein